MMPRRETDLELPETSGKLTVVVNPDDYMIAKLTPEFDIEKDRGDLVAVPRPGTLSTAEKLGRDIEALRQENDQKFENAEKRFEEKLKSALATQRSELENHFKTQLKLERSKNSYYFGALTTIRIWGELLYGRVIEEIKKIEEEEEIKEPPLKRAKKEPPKSFNEFFRDFIYSGGETLIKTKMRDSLKLSYHDISLIRGLNWGRNFHAHGEREFFAAVSSKNPNLIQEALDLLRESMEDAQYYKEKDVRIIEIASTFLKNIREDLLNQNLLIE